MKMIANVVIAAIGLVVMCVNANAEPLADFDSIIKRCREAFDLRPTSEVVYAGPAKSWVKRLYAPAKITYDMRKTESAVSPYVAHIQITEVASAQPGEDEDSARALHVSMEENVMRSVRRINFAYQDNAWTVMGGTSILEVKRDAGEQFSVVKSARIGRESVLEFQGPIAYCVAASRY